MCKIFELVIAVLLILSSFAFDLLAQNKQGSSTTPLTYSAIIVDAETGEPLPMAIVEIDEMGVKRYSDADGRFLLRRKPVHAKNNSCTLSISYLGYAPYKKQIKLLANSSPDTLRLQPSSYALNHVLVVGEYSSKESGKTKIKKEALEYLQPTGLQDLFMLTPGGLLRNPGLKSVQQVQMREARSSRNSALGTSIVVDDAPISNDANLQGMGNSNAEMRNNTTMNSGIDLRLLSVDQIESVEIIQGIPSVRYGNLTSGVVIMHTKTGHTPLELRVQSDPYTKLASAGKGFNVGRGQTIYIGGDYAKSNVSITNPIDSYTRLTGLLKYAYTGTGEWSPKLNLSLSYTGAIDNKKYDPEVMTSRESYKSNYNRLGVNARISMKPRSPWLESLEATLSFSYLHDLVQQEKWISPRTTLVQPLLKETGEGEGRYLPNSYFSVFETDGKPLSLFTQIRSTHRWEYKALQGLLLLGAELKWDKNKGRGTVYDPALPPNPGSSLSSRPIAYNDIPGMMPMSIFAEQTLYFPIFMNWKGELRAGLRCSKDLLLIGKGYDLSKKILFEPRIQGSISAPAFVFVGDPVLINMYLGYGKNIKMPTLAYLYPEPGYYDFVEANYYHADPDKRLLWVRTYYRDRTNPKVQVNREEKWDLGLHLKWKGAHLLLNLFYHFTDQGFQYRSNVDYMPFNRYTYDGILSAGKPSLDLFNKERVDYIQLVGKPDNSVRTEKRGLEYSLSFPEIKSMRTNLSLQGSFYKTKYGNSMPMAYSPSVVINGKSFPYIGFYEGRDNVEYSRFHTLLRTDTHIPKLRLIFSSSLQSIWFVKRQELPFVGLPNYWFDEKAKKHAGNDLDLNDPLQKQLNIPSVDALFEASKQPISVSFNMKMTKEFTRHLKVSFFVNNLITYDPIYESNLKTRHQNRKTPFFGSEIRIQF